MRTKILATVKAVIQEYNDELETPVDLKEGEKTRLFGASSVLDSIQLVTLIVMIEEGIEDEFDKSINLANEKAMSRRVSPFSTLGHLCDYVEELLKNG